MGRPRFRPIRKTLTAIALAATIILTIAVPATASWWLQNRHDCVAVHHPEWNENYAETPGQIGDYDRLHVWHYGDGGFDRDSTGLTIDGLRKESLNNREASSKSEAYVRNVSSVLQTSPRGQRKCRRRSFFQTQRKRLTPSDKEDMGGIL
jgi:hypothetical protein